MLELDIEFIGLEVGAKILIRRRELNYRPAGQLAVRRPLGPPNDFLRNSLVSPSDNCYSSVVTSSFSRVFTAFMSRSTTPVWRDAIRPWVFSAALPAPLLLFWHSPVGRGYALMLFFCGSMSLVAQVVWHELRRGSDSSVQISRDEARRRFGEILAIAVASLTAAWLVFTLECILINNPHNFGTVGSAADKRIWWHAVVFEAPRDFAAPILAALSIAASICIVPFFTMLTRSCFAAVVFSGTLVACMKFVGAIVVVAKFGWYANEEGHMTLPWSKPDLLVWLFLGFSSLLSIACFVLGSRRFVRELGERRVGELLPSAQDIAIVK